MLITPRVAPRVAAFSLALILCTAAPHARAQDASPPLDAHQAERLFVLTVKPLITAKCLGCHGEPGKRVRSEFLLTSRETMIAGGESGEHAVVPGDAEASPLFVAVTWRDEDLQMPPKENDRLTPEQVESLRTWIDAGAPWPEVDAATAAQWASEAADGVTVVTSGGLSDDWTNRRYDPAALWAYRPRTDSPVPWDHARGSTNAIDAYVNRRLDERGIEPAPRADKRTLIRRVTLDLTGLPPTPEQVAAFLADDAPEAYERLVDRLLASPRYGEKMAQRWLDVARYADSAGFANDYERPNAWRYRDYIIRSFNDDKPYDRFVTEQIAGDELDENEPENLIAVGFLRMGPWEHTGMSVAAVTRQQFLDDVVQSVGVTFLGQSLRCARCHDHKFDPIPTRDYYSFQAIFSPVQFADRPVPFLDAENVGAFEADRQRVQARLDASNAILDRLSEKSDAALQAALEKHGVDRIDQLPPEVMDQRKFFGLTPYEQGLVRLHGKHKEYYERQLKRYTDLAYSLYSGPPRQINSNRPIHRMPREAERAGDAERLHILLGGALEAPGDPVSPATLSAIRSLSASAPGATRPDGFTALRVPDSLRGRRLALAEWITHPDNPLTARVLVNRIWQMHFAEQAIVATPNDFGKMGARPTHPELLDHLAGWFIDNGWSIKKLHRLIVTSDAYTRAAQHPSPDSLATADPANTLLAFYPARRLSADELRDTMLAVTGELNHEAGGLPAYPEIHWEVALQPRHVMGSIAPAYLPNDLPAQRHRRTIYTVRIRSLPDPMLEVFNRPGPDISCERRDSTTITPQVFTLLNSRFTQSRSLALANRALDESGGDIEAAIGRTFALTLGRAPTAEETRLATEHVAASLADHRGLEPEPFELPRTVRRRKIEELTGEPFEWTEELDQLDAFVPDLSPHEADPQTRALAELCLVLLNTNEFAYIY